MNYKPNTKHFRIMERNNLQQGVKNPTTATAAAEGRELTNAEAAALGFNPTQRYTFYDFTKKGGRK